MLSLSRRFRPALCVRLYATCWSCQTSTVDVICQKCGKVQPVDEKCLNYFKVLHQSERFSLDGIDLQKSFRDLQKKLHPDKFANASEEEKSYSADQSALVNQAYQTLSKPIRRATYLLKLNGVTLQDVKLPQDFLVEMMDFNEQIDDADSRRKEDLLAEISKLQEEHMVLLEQALSGKDIIRASEVLAKIKYFENLCNRLN